MAEVSLARYVGPEGFEKRLVIKQLRPELVRDARLLRLFFDEARTHVALSHGNLVPVFDFGRVGNAHFIAMEHVVGEDLFALLERMRTRGEPLPVGLVAYIGTEVARGLAYVHRQRLVHRDVAPRNVLLSVEGEVKLSDFGIALTADDATTASICGTLAYVAPEVARGEAIDGRADQYALGLLLAEAVLGHRVRPPAEPNEALGLARAALAVDVPGPLHDIVWRTTQPDREARFATTDELQTACEQIALSHGGIANAARQLAALVEPPPTTIEPAEAAVPIDNATPTATSVPTPTSVETYFLGRESDATFVKEVLIAPSPPEKRGGSRGLQIGAAVIAVGLAIGSATWMAQRFARATTAPTTTLTPPVPIESPAPTAPNPAPAIPIDPTQPAPSAKPTAPSAPTERPGELLVLCTPWCELIVDHRARGIDGRTHQVALPAGRHQVAVRRLDDRQERAVVLRAGQSTKLEFTFQ